MQSTFIGGWGLEEKAGLADVQKQGGYKYDVHCRTLPLIEADHSHSRCVVVFSFTGKYRAFCTLSSEPEALWVDIGSKGI